MRAAFIINPVAGPAKLGRKLAPLLETWAQEEGFKAGVYLTQGPGQATELASNALAKGYDMVVAVGGDGTVREVALALMYTDTPLGIVAIGSGNGVARHLGVPLQPRLAVAALQHSARGKVDMGSVNGHLFLMVFGLGFDAEVAALFAELPGRGLQAYVQAGLQAFAKRKPFSVQVDSPVGNFTGQALMLTTANASQFGNNAFIAPVASMQDGYVNMSLVPAMPQGELAEVVGGVFTKNIQRLASVWQQATQTATLETGHPVAYHLDGEAMGLASNFEITVLPKVLTVCYDTEQL